MPPEQVVVLKLYQIEQDQFVVVVEKIYID